MKLIRKIVNKIAYRLVPNLRLLDECEDSIRAIMPVKENLQLGGEFIKINYPTQLRNVAIGNYTYIGQNANIFGTKIGKFCSIGPNLICGTGMHPTNGISTAPMFYSAENKSNGTTLCSKTKYEERSLVEIGNDVFIGANVVILNGVKIGNGAVIGAGAVVAQDVPDYAIVGGVPAKIIRYRFPDSQVNELQKIQWWNFSDDKLKMVEQYFYDTDKFISECKCQ